jgi:hypothetical protein
MIIKTENELYNYIYKILKKWKPIFDKSTDKYKTYRKYQVKIYEDLEPIYRFCIYNNINK